jgi:predicted enzyme related to lactoylglutathione lyase
MGGENLRVGIVQINVTDLGAAWRFYVDTLGITGRQTLGPGKPFELDFGRGGPTVLVYPARNVAKPDYPSGAGVTLVLFTDDIHATVAEWKAKGVPFIRIAWAKDESGIADTPFGPFIAFRDPFGNVHELLQPRAG